MAGRLTTHVLDTAHGRPAAGLWIQLFRIEGGERTMIVQVETNQDGRCDRPLLEGTAMREGLYELVFRAGDYLREAGATLPDTPFFDEVPVRFGIAATDRHYHVPLLLSPYGYSTYRGS